MEKALESQTCGCLELKVMEQELLETAQANCLLLSKPQNPVSSKQGKAPGVSPHFIHLLLPDREGVSQL